MMRVQPTQTTVRALLGIRCGDHAISRPLTTKVISDCRTILTHSIINGEIQGEPMTMAQFTVQDRDDFYRNTVIPLLSVFLGIILGAILGAILGVVGTLLIQWLGVS